MATVLCIEDETAIRQDIVEELHGEGYHTFEATNGVEGLDAILQQKPDLVLCDINMPIMSGFELLDVVRDKHPEFADMPFIFLSALADKADIISGKIKGADDYLTKPIDFDLMNATLKVRLGQVSRMKDKRQRDIDNLISLISTTAENDGNKETQVTRPEAIDPLLCVELQNALEREEFVLFYQPRMDARTGELAGAEALIRWQHPEKGMVPPVNFIPVAEASGLINPIGEWVLRTACKQGREWQEQENITCQIAVNLSSPQFQQANLASTVKSILQETGFDPYLLELEITESMFLEDTDDILHILDSLHGQGIGIAIDDFGTGYSSLSYLKRIPADIIKIDQSFVRNILENPQDAAIAGAIIEVGHAHNMRIVAEGIETEDQLEYLKMIACNEFQGYFFSKPVPAAEFANFAREFSSVQNGGDKHQNYIEFR